MIEIKNLSKKYQDHVVLRDINLHVTRGSICGIVGRSGVGKSTLLRCINGLEQYDSGNLLVDGTEVGSLDERQMRLFRRDVGMIFQNFSLITRATVYENIALPMRFWHADKRSIEKKVNELLEIVEIPEKRNSLARELSGGQKQRVAIARALTMRPKILLCDEATSALDPKSTQSVTSLLKQINRELNITILVVTHEMDVVNSICDYVEIMEDGMIQASGTVEEIFLKRPSALKNLLGEEERALPEEGVNIEMTYIWESEQAQTLSRMARDLDLDFRILNEHQVRLQNKLVSAVSFNVAENDAPRVENYLSRHGVNYRVLEHKMRKGDE